MALRGREPEAGTKRLKAFMFSPAGVGKTMASIQFPNAYIIDGEHGTDEYGAVIKANKSKVFHTTMIEEVIEEVRALLTERHPFRTLVIDPITTMYDDLVDRCESRVGSDHGRQYGEAAKYMKRLFNMVTQIDMNVIVTAHQKDQYGDNMKVIGTTFDGWKKLDYRFDLVLNLQRQGKRRVARVIKTRVATFPDGDSFDWSYEEIQKRWDTSVLERDADVASLATNEQLDQIQRLLQEIRLPDGMVAKWFAKAGVDLWEDMPADVIAKCIAYMQARIPAGAAA